MITQLDLPLFSAAVARVAPYAPAKSGLSPVLTFLHIRATESQLTLTATDLQQTATLTTPYSGPAWEACTDAKRLTHALKRLKGDMITVSYDDLTLTLRAGRSSVALPCIDPTEYPDTNSQLGDPIGEVSGDQFARVLSVVAPSMSTDEARPNLVGTLVTARDSSITAVSTDGYRLHTITEALALSDFEGLVPAPSVPALARLAKSSETLRLYARGADALSVTTDTGEGEITVSIRLLAERFPPWEAVIPSAKGAVVLSLNVTEALEALSIASLVGEGDKLARVELAHEGAVWRVGANGAAGEAQGEVSVEASGDAPTVYVASAYLLDALKVAQRHSERVTVQITAPTAPLLITPEGAESVRLIVVPLRDIA